MNHHRSLKAIYPGSFDPPTMGHMDIIERVSRLIDELVVVVGRNPQKGEPLFSVDERIEMLTESCSHLDNVRVESFGGLLIDYAIKEGASVIIRGLRAVSDFEGEFQMAQMNRRLSDNIETLFVMTNWEHSYLSSSAVREVADLGGPYAGLVPVPVERRLKAQYEKKKGRG